MSASLSSKTSPIMDFFSHRAGVDSMHVASPRVLKRVAHMHTKVENYLFPSDQVNTGMDTKNVQS